MGWKLVHQGTGGSDFYLTIGKELIIGRKGCDFIIETDQHVSRKHASFIVSHPAENMKYPNKLPIVKVVDLKSKFGTFVNGKEVPLGGVILKKEDIVMLGQHESRYRIVYEPLVVTTSCLTPPEKVFLIKIIRELGGHCISEWKTNCTHLVMNEVKVTIKAASALLTLKPLVNVKFFMDYVEKIRNSENAPDPKNYIPKLGEIVLEDGNVSFDVVPNRENVFKDKTFLFLSVDQFKKMQHLLSLGGAKSVLMEKSLLPSYKEMMLKPDVCVIKDAVQMSSEVHNPDQEVNIFLKKHNKRLIPESDIGLAVVNCSTEFYCNPDFDPGETSYLKIQSQSLTQNEILNVPETAQSEDIINFKATLTGKRSIQTIPETIQSIESVDTPSTSRTDQREVSTSKRSKSVFSKRARIDDENQDQPASKSFRSDIVAETLENEVSDFPVSVKVEPSSQCSVDIVKNTIPESEVATQPMSSNWDLTEPMSPDVFDGDEEVQTKCSSEKAKPEKERLERNTKKHKHENEVSETPQVEPLNKKPKLETQDETIPETETEDDIIEDQGNIEEDGCKTEIQLPGFINAKSSVKNAANMPFLEEEEDIKLNLLGAKFVSLVVRKPKIVNVNVSCSNSVPVKNFKSFRKVTPIGGNRLPNIIGRNELKTFTYNHVEVQKEAFQRWMDEEEKEEVNLKESQDSEENLAPITRSTVVVNDSENWI